MAEAASLPLPYPEAAVIEEDSLAAQSLALALELPERPLVLGGCCCSHVGAVEALSARHGRIAVVWLDAHGDLNTLETLAVRERVGDAVAHAARLRRGAGRGRRARRRAQPRPARGGVHRRERRGDRTRGGRLRARGTVGAYVAVDFDALGEDEVAPFMPEPGGLSLEEAEQLLADVREARTVPRHRPLGARPDERNLEPARPPDRRARPLTVDY